MMARRWIILALVSLGISLPASVQAQYPAPGSPPSPPSPSIPGMPGMPAMPGTPAMPGMPAQPSSSGIGWNGYPEPTPISSTGSAGAYGQQDITAAGPLTLTNDGTPNAFAGDSAHAPFHGFYMGFGAMALKREGLGSSLLAVRNPQQTESGNSPPFGAAAFVDFDDIGMRYNVGLRGTLGYQWGYDLFEVNWFYIFQRADSHEASEARAFNLPFAAGPQPMGFGGNNNLWLQTDIVKESLETAMGGFEVNYRRATGGGVEWIFGTRFLDLSERYSIFANDDGITGLPGLENLATYTSRSHSRIVGPQLGIEGEWRLHNCLAIGGLAKGTWGVNFNEIDILLQRGDGFVAPDGPNAHRSTVRFAHIYELGLFLDFLLSERIRIRGGYQALWIVNVPEAQEQVDFNLANIEGARGRHTGSIFYHGPAIEIHLGF